MSTAELDTKPPFNAGAATGTSTDTAASASASAAGPHPPPASSSDAGLGSALSTGKALVLLQLLSRLLTFTLNQVLVRLAPPSVFGTAAIQFDLVSATILFLSREGIRNALLRRDGGGDTYESGSKTESTAERGSSRSSSLAVWPLRLGLAVAAGTVALYLYTSSGETAGQAYFYPSLALYVLAALLELSIEPLYVRALTQSPPRLRVRVQAEGGMAIVRAVVSCACLVLGARVLPGSALLGFAVGHCAGAVWLAGRYIAEFGGLSVIPSLLVPSTGVTTGDKHIKDLAVANTRQSVVKHVLTEADRIAVGQIANLGDQGGYAVAMNYGSLVARIVFQPLEETLLLHWSRSLSDAVPLLALALRMSLHLALLLPVFLPPLLPIVLPLLLPRQYRATSAAATLQTYLVCYIPLLSLNGILEAFHAASAKPDQVARQAKYMIASSGAFALSLLLLTRGGEYLRAAFKLPKLSEITLFGIPGSAFTYTSEQALIYSSCVAMLVRIAYAFMHARRIAAEQVEKQRPQGKQPSVRTPSSLSVSSIVPRPIVRHVVLVGGAVLWYLASKGSGSLRDQAGIFGVGAAAGLCVLFTIYLAEKDEIRHFGSKP